MISILCTLLWAVAIIWSTAVLAGVLREAAALRNVRLELLRKEVLPTLTTLLTTISTRLALPTAPDTEASPMPPRLSTWIGAWEDPWAVEGQRAYANQLYIEHSDWSKVEMIMKREVEESMRETE